MKKFVFALLCFALAPAASAADGCRSLGDSLRILKNKAADPDQRAATGACLVKGHLDSNEVATTVLKIIRDPGEDLFLREDLITAFADSPLRKRTKVEERIAPKLDSQEKNAIERTIASASDLLAVTQAVNEMEDIAFVTKHEDSFFKAFSEIALDEGSHIVLRSVAIEALEALSVRVVRSGLYSSKSIRLAHDTLKSISEQDDSASYYSGASLAYMRMADAGLPGYSMPVSGGSGGRALSSVRKRNQ